MTVFCPHCGKSLDVSTDDLGSIAEYEYLEAECPYCQKSFQISTSQLFQAKPRLNQAVTSAPRQPQRQSAKPPSYLQTEVQRRRKRVPLRKIIVWAVIAIVVGAISINYAMELVTKKKAVRRGQLLDELEKNMVPIPVSDDRMAFDMCKYEVTQELWEAIMGTNPSIRKGAKLPVENISYDDCEKFIIELNSWARYYGHYGYMIPTKEQWETASAGGVNEDAGEYGFCKLVDGTLITVDNLDKVAWYSGNSQMTTHPVGQKMPNAFGLYDMFGNVSEWTCHGENAIFGGMVWFYFGGSYRDKAKDCYTLNILHSNHIFPSIGPSWDRGIRLARWRPDKW